MQCVVEPVWKKMEAERRKAYVAEKVAERREEKGREGRQLNATQFSATKRSASSRIVCMIK